VAYRLYLPKSWAEDAKHRAKAGMTDDIAFQAMPKNALEQLAWADTRRDAHHTDKLVEVPAETLHANVRLLPAHRCPRQRIQSNR
jgi:DDE superfamily endonuclease